MTDDERQRLNIRAIRVTLGSALHDVPADRRDLCIARARQLLAHAREDLTTAAAVADAEALDAELRGSSVAARREG